MTWARTPGAAPIYRTPTHRKARTAMLKTYQPGDPCCLCHHPMWPPTSTLHADHDPTTGQYRGLAHGTTPCETCGVRCNVEDGARRARRRRARQTARRTRRPQTILRW